MEEPGLSQDFWKPRGTRRGQAASQPAPPTRVRWNGHRSPRLGHWHSYSLPGLPLLGLGTRSGVHAGTLSQLGVCLTGVHAPFRVPTIASSLHLPAWETHKPLPPNLPPRPWQPKIHSLSLWISCSGRFIEMESHSTAFCVWLSHLHCIWGLICFAGCVTAIAWVVLPALCPWDWQHSTFPKPRIWRAYHTLASRCGVAPILWAQWLLSRTPGPLTSAQNPLSFPFCKLCSHTLLASSYLPPPQGRPPHRHGPLKACLSAPSTFPTSPLSCEVWKDTSSCHPLCLICLLG